MFGFLHACNETGYCLESLTSKQWTNKPNTTFILAFLSFHMFCLYPLALQHPHVLNSLLTYFSFTAVLTPLTSSRATLVHALQSERKFGPMVYSMISKCSCLVTGHRVKCTCELSLEIQDGWLNNTELCFIENVGPDCPLPWALCTNLHQCRVDMTLSQV